MVSTDDELELLLSEAGNKLLDPPSSVDELLPLLDKAEGLLSRVEQSPSESIQDTLPSFMKALMADKLFTHSDEEVKVAVASCISEITRITAPDAPYEDDQMKDAFRLIVSSFENLHDKSSRSYAKRTSILETVARVRSCVVMLDLECDDLILEMFQHFLKSIREYHHKNVFESMVTIITLIIEESEDVSPDLLSCLLAYVKKDKKEVSPISQALVENVLKNCASTLKPCLVEVFQSLGSTVDDYDDAVRSMFQDVGAVGMSHNHATGEHKVDKRAPRINPASRSLKLRITNVVVQKKEVDSVSTKEEHRNQSSQSKSNTKLGPGNARGVDSDDAANLESLRVNRKRKGRQFAGSLISRKKETKELLGNNKEHDNGNLDDELPSKGKKKAPGKTLPKAEDRENLSTVSGSKNMGELVGNQLKKRGRKKKREDSKEVVRDGAELSEKELEEMSDSEAKAQLRSCTKVSAGDSVNSKSAITLKIGRNIIDVSGEAEEKHGKSSLKKVNESNNLEDGSSIKKQKNKKQLSSEKEATETGVEKSAVKEKKKVVSSSPKPFSKINKDKQRSFDTAETNNKGKRTPGKKSSDVKAYGAELIGFPIRVWWPQDHQFYEGFVDSFDSGKKKHTVVYNDGDQEILNLQKEKWEFVKEPTGSDQDEAPNDGSADTSPELPLKKRVKGGMEESAAKGGKKEVMTKKVGDTSSGKGKAMAPKFGKRTGVGGKSGGKSGKNSKNKSKEPPALNGKKSAAASNNAYAASNNAYESGDSKEKAIDPDEPKDDDLLSLKASIKSKGRAGKTKKEWNVSSREDVSKNGGEPEKMDSDGLVNQKGNEHNTAEVEGVNEKEDASGRDEANEDESSGPEKGTDSKTGKKWARVA